MEKYQRGYIEFLEWAGLQNWLSISKLQLNHEKSEDEIYEEIFITSNGQEVLVRITNDKISEVTTRTCFLEI